MSLSCFQTMPVTYCCNQSVFFVADDRREEKLECGGKVNTVDASKREVYILMLPTVVGSRFNL